jgi:hypothetical protein
MRIILALAVALTLAACGQSAPATYPPEAEFNFRNACQAQGASAAFCGCVWARVVAEVPAEDFIAYERVPFDDKPNHPMTAQIGTYAQACRAEAAPPVEPSPAP